jgi:hypothetical protein
LNHLHDPEPVRRAPAKRLKDDQIERTLQQLDA